ncbi:NUT family member 2G-like, partial [Phacochoerus africanus]|uniref:NUT family member 2G-like n=1 Tax=Phacochoerus africanus TaxID=41426 RepID=UPI001FD964AD
PVVVRAHACGNGFRRRPYGARKDLGEGPYLLVTLLRGMLRVDGLSASPPLGTDVVMHPGASRSYPPLTPGSQPQPAWAQPLPPPMAPLLLPGSTLLQPAHPGTPRGAPADHGPIAPGIATPAGDSVVAAPAVAAARAGKGGLAPGLPPQAAPPAAQMAFILPPGSSGPWPHGTSGAGSLHASQHRGPREDACDHRSVYQNFRRWQRFKSLARSHLPQSPDAEALSCFLIPVLRTLARLKPTMTLEEGMRRATQEWQHTSNFERMPFYEMAAKFMEFEAEDEIRMENLSCTKGVQGMPPPAPPKPAPQEPTSRKLGTRPVNHLPTGGQGKACAPRKHGPRVQPTRPRPRRSRQPLENKALKESPPEAVRECGDIMEALVGPGPSATGESDAECGEEGNDLAQDEDGTFPDPELLSYIDKLCSQEDFVTKVEAVIHPRFLAELLSPEPELDLSALAEELEQEEGLSPEELVQKRALASKEEDGVPATPNHRAPQLDSSPSESAAGQDAQRNETSGVPSVWNCTALSSPGHKALGPSIRTQGQKGSQGGLSA